MSEKKGYSVVTGPYPMRMGWGNTGERVMSVVFISIPRYFWTTAWSDAEWQPRHCQGRKEEDQLASSPRAPHPAAEEALGEKRWIEPHEISLMSEIKYAYHPETDKNHPSNRKPALRRDILRGKCQPPPFELTWNYYRMYEEALPASLTLMRSGTFSEYTSP